TLADPDAVQSSGRSAARAGRSRRCVTVVPANDNQPPCRFSSSQMRRRRAGHTVIPPALGPHTGTGNRVLGMAPLTPAAELAATNTIRHPNESDEYRRARQALLIEEIELRRQAERVAELRRNLPPGGAVERDYY